MLGEGGNRGAVGVEIGDAVNIRVSNAWFPPSRCCYPWKPGITRNNALLYIVYIYCSVVRSVLEYACAVWHPGLSNKLSKDIERVQKRCLKIIYSNLSYSEALEKSGLVRLESALVRPVLLYFTCHKTRHTVHRCLVEIGDLFRNI